MHLQDHSINAFERLIVEPGLKNGSSCFRAARSCVHGRMPVILGSEDWEKWLGDEPANENELKANAEAFPSERMTAWPVNKAVGNVKNDAPDLIERTAVQASLT